MKDYGTPEMLELLREAVNIGATARCGTTSICFGRSLWAYRDIRG